MIILYKHYTEITNILLQTFSIFPLFLLCIYFFDKWFIPNLQRKIQFFSCFRNLNCESNLKWAKNGPKESTVTQKEYLEIFLLFCILRKQKKQSFYMKEGWLWARKSLTAETKKRHYFLILIYITDVSYRTL